MLILGERLNQVMRIINFNKIYIVNLKNIMKRTAFTPSTSLQTPQTIIIILFWSFLDYEKISIDVYVVNLHIYLNINSTFNIEDFFPY